MSARQARRRVSPHLRAAIAAALCVGLLAACGSRVGGDEILASNGGGTVRLSPDSLDALRAAIAPQTQAAPQQASAAAAADAPTAAAPGIGPGRATSKTDRRTGTTVSAPYRTTMTAARDAAPAVAEQCPKQLETIPIGHIGTFSGVAGPLTASAITTMAAWAKDVNSRGGLACHPVRVFSRDDGADSARAAALANELAQRERVVAFVGTLVLAPAGFVQAVQKLRIPAVGGGVGEDAWFANDWFYSGVATPYDLIVGLLKAGAEKGKRKLGVLYCVEATGCGDIAKKIRNGGAAEAGVDLVYETAVSVTQTDYTAQCLNAQKAGVDLLGLAVDGASMARVARSCASIGYRPLLTTGAFLIGDAQSKDQTLRSFGVVTAAGVAPWFERDRPGLTEYQRALARWAPTLVADGASIDTWTSAKLFEAALSNAADQARAGAVTPVLVVAGLHKIKDDTLGGLAGPLDFTSAAKRRAGNGCVFYQYLGPEGWTAPRGSKPVCLKR